MITNPNATKVLCYGDSNTHGQKPDRTGRYASNVRWTGLLQDVLGEQYYVIEEGLGSRTTDLDYDKKPGRNGKTYLAPCLHSHNPIDIVTIMLGTNDLKTAYGRTAEAIALALGGLVDDVRTYGETPSDKPPEIILISPIKINYQADKFIEYYTGYYDEAATLESERLSEAIKDMAEARRVYFLDAASVAEPGSDGIHLDEPSQHPLALLIANTIQKIHG